MPNIWRNISQGGIIFHLRRNSRTAVRSSLINGACATRRIGGGGDEKAIQEHNRPRNTSQEALYTTVYYTRRLTCRQDANSPLNARLLISAGAAEYNVKALFIPRDITRVSACKIHNAQRVYEVSAGRKTFVSDAR